MRVKYGTTPAKMQERRRQPCIHWSFLRLTDPPRRDGDLFDGGNSRHSHNIPRLPQAPFCVSLRPADEDVVGASPSRIVTVQVVGRASRLPHRASRPRCQNRGRDALLAGETPAPLPEQLPRINVTGLCSSPAVTRLNQPRTRNLRNQALAFGGRALGFPARGRISA